MARGSDANNREIARVPEMIQKRAKRADIVQ